MTINDQRETTRDAGFTRVMDPRDARRQLHASAVILGILGLAAVMVLATPRMPQVATSSAPVRLTVQAPQIVHVQQAAIALQPGG